MTKGQTTFTIIAIIVVGVLLAGYYGFKKFFDNINFDFAIDGNIGGILGQLQSSIVQKTPPQQFGLTNSVSNNGIPINVPVKMTIDNLNSTKIIASNVSAGIKYNGVDIMQTNPNSSVLSKVVIPANTKGYVISDTVQTYVNQNSIQFLTDLIAGKKPTVQISLDASKVGLVGLPLKTTFNYTL